MLADRAASGDAPQTIDPLATTTDAADTKKHRRRRGGRNRNRAGKTMAKIHETSAQRQHAWRRGDRPDVVDAATDVLHELYDQLGVERARGEVDRPALEVDLATPPLRGGGRR